MRVVVTGGSGRLGRSVVDILARRGHEVLNADLRSSFEAPFFEVDLTRPGDAYQVIAHTKADAVIHLAAMVGVLQCPEQEILRANVAATFNVYQAAADLGVRVVISASSPTVIGHDGPEGWTPQYLPIDEDHPLRPGHAYSLSKVLGEEVMRYFARKSGRPLRAFAIRPGFVVSPEDWASDVSTNRRATIAGRLNNPDLAARSMFNYVDARDVADLIALLLENSTEVPSGEVFYAGAPDALARAPLAELIPRYFPKTAEIAATLTGTRPAFTTAKAARLLGWRPQRSWRAEMAGRIESAGSGSVGSKLTVSGPTDSKS